MTQRRPGRRPAVPPRPRRRDGTRDTGGQRAVGSGPVARGGSDRLGAVAAAAAGTGRTALRRPRLTGRAAVLVLVVAVLTVSFASSLNAYFRQRSHIEDLKADIARREASIDALEREKARWEDPAYVQAQARARFGYILPGEESFVVLDENGRPLDSTADLGNPADDVRGVPTAWWETAWGSVELAGRPPTSR